MNEPEPASPDPTSMEALYRRPGFMIRRAHQIVLALFDEAAGELGITTTQYSVLHALRARPGIDQTALCELIGIDRSTATVVLRLLERNGLVVRIQSERDRRCNQLGLTPAGEALLARTPPLTSAISGRMREVMSADELEQLTGLLGKFVGAFNDRVRIPLRPDAGARRPPDQR
ncbi:MarR family winged helix-turn-helix transcriptional regulator [Novosphingobium cyanobacteriorum]|uniref:MarR family transcriptional regulator n=1 Tax=Novosphingobium cyanobacteriorum TaxID=3024215 RepID=A0ABT6CIG5_9SPHN|nr:MarR family transcriptional regulator [Novosphingobium cyanobacteriorum]MDF8333701.1 MarR family transcriptional regulator [Novosphingobium cyanobacteriorum]